MARTTAMLSVLLLVLVACDPMSPPLVRHEGGYRLTADNNVELWMGDDCEGVTAIEVVLSREDEELDLARFESTEDGGASISHWTLVETPQGFETIDPLDTEWSEADTIRVRVEAGDRRTSSHVVVESFSEEADQQEGWYVQDEGWVSESEYAELIAGESGILPLCPTE